MQISKYKIINCVAKRLLNFDFYTLIFYNVSQNFPKTNKEFFFPTFRRAENGRKIGFIFI